MTELERIAALFTAQQDEALDQALEAVDPHHAVAALEADAPSLGAWLVLARRGGPWAWDAVASVVPDAPLPWLALVRDAAARCVDPSRTPTLLRTARGWTEPTAQEVVWTLGALSLDGRALLREWALDPTRELLERVTAVQALRYHSLEPDCVGVIRAAMREPDAGSAHVLRREAALTAGQLGLGELAPDLLVAATDGDPATARTAWWALQCSAPAVHERLGFVTRTAEDLAAALPARLQQVLPSASEAEKVAWMGVAGRTRASALAPLLQRLRAQGDEAMAVATAGALLRITGAPELIPDALRSWARGGTCALPSLEAIAEVAAEPGLRPSMERALVEVGTTEPDPEAQARLLEVASWLAPRAAAARAEERLPSASGAAARELRRLLSRLQAPAPAAAGRPASG